MKRLGRWVVVGLLCASGTIGCAQLPSRGLFARRPRPAAIEEPAAVEPESSDADDESLAMSSNTDDASVDSLPTDSGGGLFDVSSGDPLGTRSSAVEAPSPKRRTTAPLSAESRPPNTFIPPGNVRELRPESPRNPIELANGSETPDSRGGVVTADYSQDTNGGYSTDIELAAGQSRANNTNNGAANPWDRFRGLTSNLEPEASQVQQPLVTERPDAMNSPAVEQPRSWPAFTSASVNPAAINNANAPELWPNAPGASGFNPGSPPQNVQWVHAEQPVSKGGAVPGVPFPPQPNSPAYLPTANAPLNFGPPDGAPAAIVPIAASPELERLITQTTVEAAALSPADNEIARQLYLRKHVQLRLLHLMAGQMDRALQPVPGIDPADQEFWQQMLWGMANYFDTQGMPDSAERATQTIAQLKSAAARLQEKARLELRNVAFCHKISGFGNYQRFKRDEFTPGQPVLLYAEVGNFKSELVADGQFRTLLKSTLEIVEGGPTGRVIETLPLTPSEDRCRNQRRDYYHSYEFAIPQGCNPGPHTLRLRVEDQLGKKLALTTLNFTVQ